MVILLVTILGAALGVAPTARVVNPTSAASLAVYVALPVGAGPFPAVVMVPPGRKAGRAFPSAEAIGALTHRGIAVVRWDPDGRGASGGTEDAGGAVHQAGLRAVIAYAVAREDITDDQVGVISYSMGITIAAGALSGQDTGARFLIDWEGPIDRWWTLNCTPAGEPRSRWEQFAPCDDEAYWAQREARHSMGGVTVPYLRIQSARDHMHASNHDHAIELLAIAQAGGVPWTRLNDLDANLPAADLARKRLARIDPTTRDQRMPDWVEELMALPLGDAHSE